MPATALATCEIFGTIYDAFGQPAAGVRIGVLAVYKNETLILDSTREVTTDENGYFTIPLPRLSTAVLYASVAGLNISCSGTSISIPDSDVAELSTLLSMGPFVAIPPLVYAGNNLSLPKATPTQDGYLSAADYIRFDAGGTTVAGVSAFNGRSGVVVPILGDYAAFYAPLVHAHTRSQITDLGVFSTSQPGLVPQPSSGDAAKVLTGAGTWVDASSATAMPGTYYLTNFKASGSKQKFSGAISAGALATLTLTVASDFAVGQGIFIALAGSGGPLVTKVDAIDATKKIITLHDAATGAVIAVANNVQHDDTVAVQTALDTIFAAGGGTLYVPDGFYRLNGPFNAINSLVRIPYNATFPGPTTLISISIIGLNQPFPAFSGIPSTKGAIFQTDRIGPSGNHCMIAAAAWDASTDIPPTSNVTVYMEHVTWRTYPEPQISAVDMGMAGNALFRHVLIDTDTPLGDINEPPAGYFGLRSPRVNTGMAMDTFDNCYVLGYGTGAIIAEQFRSTWFSVMRCGIGFQADFNYHPAMHVTGLVWHCPIGVTFTDRMCVDFILDIEAELDTARWDCCLYDFQETSATGDQVTGWIKYSKVGGGVGTLYSALVQGCSNLTFINLNALGDNYNSPATFRKKFTATDITELKGETRIFDGETMMPLSVGVDDSESSGYRNVRIANSGGAIPGGSLLAGLTSMWKLDETGSSTIRNDSVGTNHLTPSVVPEIAGKIGNGAHFNATGDRLTHASNATLSPGNADYTFALWVKIEDTGSNRDFLSKAGSGGSDEYIIGYDHATAPDRFRFTVQGGGTYASAYSASSAAPVVGTWYLIVAWQDADMGTINIQVNGGAVDSHTPIPPLTVGADTFQLGCYGAGMANYAKGIIDEVALWNGRMLDAPERGQLWNGGDGKPFIEWT
jgi:hypothetical protein